MSNTTAPVPEFAPQGSEQWRKDRLGNVTGSRAINCFDYKKPTKKQLEEATAIYALMQDPPAEVVLQFLFDEYPAEYCLQAGVEIEMNGKRATMLKEMVAERLTGLEADPEPFLTYDMKWGTINENFSKVQYQFATRNLVKECGLIKHPTIENCAASPDGLVGEHGVWENKSPRSGNHLATLKQELIEDEDYKPEQYYFQIHLEMDCAQREWCDFTSYDSRLPKDLQIMIHRIPINHMFVTHVLRPGIIRFNQEVDQELEFFKNYRKALFARAARKKEERENAGKNSATEPNTNGTEDVTPDESPAASDRTPETSGITEEQAAYVLEKYDREHGIDSGVEDQREDDAAQDTSNDDDSRSEPPSADSGDNTKSQPNGSEDDRRDVPNSKPGTDGVARDTGKSSKKKEASTKPAPELEAEYYGNDLSEDELQVECQQMFAHLKMTMFDQRRTIKESSKKKIVLEHLNRSELLELHMKLNKYVEVADEVESKPIAAPKTQDHAANIALAFGDDIEVQN